ncbi:MAG: hypothetical protein H6Q89_1485, partial [Myxococcaceae bacterium]|nr:hypothetical protein [Myxococcaceae bacterium]
MFTLGYAVFASAAAILTAGRFSAGLTPWLLRVWGKSMLWIAGVRLEVEGLAHLTEANGKVAVFNHSSMLDTFV